jgi:hypothetical protein
MDFSIHIFSLYTNTGTFLGILSFDSVFTSAGQKIRPSWMPKNNIFADVATIPIEGGGS